MLHDNRRHLAALLLLALALVAPLAAERPPTVLAATLPTGFVRETVVDGLLAPRAIAFMPDGRMLIAERGSSSSQDINFASIRVFKNGALLPARAATFNVCGDGERGLLGLAVDPLFDTNGYVYVYYTRQAASSPVCAYNAGATGPRNRVSRITFQGDLMVPGSEVVLIDHIPADSGIHNAGDLQFGPGRVLYITTGDGGNVPSPGGNPASLGGKVLAIVPNTDPAGGFTLPADAPFASTAGARACGAWPTPQAGSGPCREIYAYGFRNPFRGTVQPGTGVPFVFDVGGGAWEEVNRVVAGGNYGFPTREGACEPGTFCNPATEPPVPGLINPIYAYPHTTINSSDDAAIIGGAFYTGSVYPAEYQGSLFFGDVIRGWLRRLVYDAGTDSWSMQEFATGTDGVIGVRTGAAGDIYYVALLDNAQPASAIYRIRYTGGTNQAPTAAISATPSGGPVNQLFSFSAVGSADPESTTLTYNWDFGDSTTGQTSAPSATHTYSSAGPKTVTLTVTDSGQPPLTSEPVTVTVYPGNSPPSGTIAVQNLTDATRSLYYAGDTWSFSATNLSDDQALPPGAVTWDVEFHHRDHSHPFLSGITGSSGQFSIPTSGEHDPEVWYRIVLRIADSQGQVGVVTRDVLPQTAELTFETQPAGGEVILTGEALVTPSTVSRVVGMNILVEAPATRTVGGQQYSFDGWSNCGARSQVLTVPAGGGSYSARYILGLTGGLCHVVGLPLVSDP